MKKPFCWQLLVLVLLCWFAIGCAPPVSIEDPAATFVPTEAPIAVATVELEELMVTGCAEGGAGVFTPEDARCYLDNFAPEFVREIDEETAVLFTDPNSLAEWVGGAIIYHIPSVSTLVLDRNGDIDPQFSHIEDRTALVAFNELAAEPGLLAEFKQTVQAYWQTTDSGEPEIRLDAVWQDGANTVFLVAIAGLSANDDRFYCPSQTWTVGETVMRILPDCIVQDETVLVPHLRFVPQPVSGSQPQAVQVALADVPSNTLRVAEGEVTLETAVYQTAINYLTTDSAIVRMETAVAPDDDLTALEGTVDPTLLQRFVSLNQTESSLHFLFQDHQSVLMQPGSVIERDYLPAGTQSCGYFREQVPGLRGGVLTLSQIAVNETGDEALLFIQQTCGPDALNSRYLRLAQEGDRWTVVEEMGLTQIELAEPLVPSLIYNGRVSGCGDLFIHAANDDALLSEFVTLYLNARAFPLSAEPLTLELADYPEEIRAKIDLFGSRYSDYGEFPYCNDVEPVAEPLAEWVAESGTLTIHIEGSVPEETCSGGSYLATVRLENVLFGHGPEQVFLEELLFEAVAVGWCVG